MRSLLVACCLFAALPAQAQSGFTPEQLAEAAESAVAQTAPDAAAMQQAAERSERLRAMLAVAMDQSANRLGRAELRALTVALGPPSEDRDILLSWLMRGGEVAIADAGLTGIYNPHADGWLLLRWQQVGGTPRLMQAALVSGRLLRGGTEAPLDRADIPFSQALVARRLTAHASLETLTGVMPVDRFFLALPAIRVFEAEAVLAAARTQVGALAQWSRENPAALSAIDRALRRGDDPALRALPERVRTALSPMAMVATPAGHELVLQSPMYPARALFARFESGAAPALFSLDLAPQTGSGMQ